MRICVLHIITGLHTGGAERALVRLIQSGRDNSFVHQVLSLTDEGTQGSILRSLGVTVYKVDIKHCFDLPKGVQKIRSLVRQIEPDIIHGWMYHGGLFSLVAGKKTPKILGIRHSLHDLKSDKLTTRWVISFLALLSGRFNRILYNSAISKIQHEAIGYCAKNSHFIPNGFDTETFKPSMVKRAVIQKKLGIPVENFIFGNIGRYHLVKNHAGLLDSFAKLVKLKPECRLVLVGRDVSNSNSVLTKQINISGIKDKVLLLGEKQNVPGLLQAMDFYVSSSHAEAFPNVIGEAMSTGIPCIATNVGDSQVIIGNTGFLVPPNDSEQLALAMLEAANLSEGQRTSLGLMARNRIIQHYSQESSTLMYEELYHKILQ